QGIARRSRDVLACEVGGAAGERALPVPTGREGGLVGAIEIVRGPHPHGFAGRGEGAALVPRDLERIVRLVAEGNVATPAGERVAAVGNGGQGDDRSER